MVGAPMSGLELYPPRRESLEGLGLAGVDDVMHDARDHGGVSRVELLRADCEPRGRFLSPHSRPAFRTGCAVPRERLDVLRRAQLIETDRVAGWAFHRRDEDGLARARQLLADI